VFDVNFREMVEKQLIQYIQEYEQLMNDLRIVKDLELPDGYIAAGYIRNYVWDRLHGFDHRERHNDIDVVYYDLKDSSEDREYYLSRVNNKEWKKQWPLLT
jgi:hypothetical protein